MNIILIIIIIIFLFLILIFATELDNELRIRDIEEDFDRITRENFGIDLKRIEDIK